MENLLLVSHEVGVLFLLMGVGALTYRAKILTEQSIKGIVELLVVVVTPAVIIDVFSRPFDSTMLKGLGIAAILSIIIHFVAILVAKAAIHVHNENTSVVLKLGVIFSNSGFMGIPMERAILGDIGVFYGVVYMVVFNLFMWSYGLKKMQRGGKSLGAAIRSMTINPGTIGLALGLAVFLAPGELPELIATPIHFLSDLNTPLAMLVIGYYLARTNLFQALSRFSVLWSIALRLVVMPLVFFALAYMLKSRVDSNVLLALMIAAAAPTAAMVSMFAAKFERDIATSVALVSASTALSVFTMPLVITLALISFRVAH